MMTETKATKTKKLVTLLRQAGQGATFNFGDEAGDFLGAAAAAQITGEPFSKMYDMARRTSKQNLAADWKDNPATSVAGQIIGGLPYGFAKGAKATADLFRGGNTFKGAAQGAKIGAAYGGIAGVGAGDDNLASRVSSGVGSSVTGGALGAAGGAIASKLAPKTEAQAVQKASKDIAKKFSSKAEQFIAKQLAERPDLPSILKRAEQNAALSKKTGVKLTLPEMIAQSESEPLLATQKILGSKPMTAGRMEQLYASRVGDGKQAGSIEAMMRDIATRYSGGAQGYDEIAQNLIGQADKAAKNITKQLGDKAAPIYAEVAAKKVPMNAMKKLAKQHPIINEAYTQVVSDPRYSAKLQGKAPNSIEYIDAMKRVIAERIAAGKNPAQPFDTSAFSQANNDLVKLADSYVPRYAEARGVYSGEPDALAVRKRIGALANIDPQNLKRVGSDLFSGTQTNAEMAAAALGKDTSKQAVAARIYDAMDQLRGEPTSLSSKIAPNAATRAMMQAYGAGEDVTQALDVINQAKIGDRFRFGSPTQPLQEADSALQQSANAGIDLATGGKTTLLRRAMSMLPKKGEDASYYDETANLFLDQDKGLDLVRRVTQEQQTGLQNIASQSPRNQVIQQAVLPAQQGITRAGVSGTVTPQSYAPQQQPVPQHEDFSDIEALLNEGAPPPQDNFQDIEAILNGQPQASASGSLMDRIAMAESSGNPNAKASTSSASGLFQFTDGTWNDMVQKYGQQYGITADMKNDPQAQRIMAELLAQENSQAIARNTGRNPTDGDIYLAHFLGADGASDLINAIGTGAPAAQLFPAAARANQSLFFENGQPVSVERLYQRIASKVQEV